MKLPTTLIVTVAFAGAIVLWLNSDRLFNEEPVARDDRARVSEGGTVEILALANDTDRDEDPLSITTLEPPGHGAAEVSEDGRAITYRPANGFFGTDRLTYVVADPRGKTASAEVAIDVDMTPPEFHRRHGVAPLTEMLREPPTSVYGSTIDVFLYRNSVGDLREVSIAGHADSLTCARTSGAFATALMGGETGPENFLIAGAGRMSIPEISFETLIEFEEDPVVAEYLGVVQNLALFSLIREASGASFEDIEEGFGASVASLLAERDRLEAIPEVARYLRLGRAQRSAEAFLRDAQEIEAASGLLRLHNVRFDVAEAVRERIRAAAEASSTEPTTLSFSDLLIDGEREAVVYAPMRRLETAEPIVIEVPVGEFSPQGFREAVSRYRPAMESAIVGSAQRRLEFAESSLQRVARDEADCVGLSARERGETVDMTCRDQDGNTVPCSGADILRGARSRVTRGEFCAVNVPRNRTVATEWRDDAQRILQQIETLRGSGAGDVVDEFTHAALVDSMLRDWALPIRDAQAAFDHWRTQGRGRAWRAITEELAASNIDRAAFSGESLVFSVKLVGDVLRIEPLHVIDVQRTSLVIDPRLGVTAVVSPWELRTPRTPTGQVAAQDAASTIELLLDRPQDLQRRIEIAPARTMSELLDALFSLYPEEGEQWRRLAEESRRLDASFSEEYFAQLAEEAAAAPAETDEERSSRLIDLANPMFAARRVPNLSPAFRLRVAYLASDAMAKFTDSGSSGAWTRVRRLSPNAPASDFDLAASGTPRAVTPEDLDDLLRRNGLRPNGALPGGLGRSSPNIVSAPSESVVRANENRVARLIVGEDFDDFLRAVVRLAEAEAPEEARALLASASPPAAVAVEPRALVQSTLGATVARVERARASLELRQAIDEVIIRFNDGQRSSAAVLEPLMSLQSFGSLGVDIQLNNLQLNARFVSLDSGSRLGPIEGAQLMSLLQGARQSLTEDLRGEEQALTVVRLGRDQEAIIARTLFDRGDYREALDRLAPAEVPLALYSADVAFAPVEPAVLGAPDDLALRLEEESVVISAVIAGRSADVLRVDGLAPADRESLAGSLPQSVLPWSDAEPLWEQQLIAWVPAPPTLQAARARLSEEPLAELVLKAMVYACAQPGRHLLDSTGRCDEPSGSSALHDRVQSEALVEFVAPPIEDMPAAAVERFSRPMAWRFAEQQ